jgi:hypothetical protein
MWIPILIGAVYTGWVFWQRHVAEPKPAVERDPLASYGNRVKIAQFYVENRELPRGGKTLMCYGVVNAASVRIDPPVEKVWPAVSRCFDLAPARTTRYTLTAEGLDHATVSESVEVAVKP